MVTGNSSGTSTVGFCNRVQFVEEDDARSTRSIEDVADICFESTKSPQCRIKGVRSIRGCHHRQEKKRSHFVRNRVSHEHLTSIRWTEQEDTTRGLDTNRLEEL